MGSGFEYKCSKCNKEYGITLGIGMMYPVVYKELVDDVKNGAFGEEWKQLFDETENVAVDAENRVYICHDCGSWIEEKGLSLYVADNEYALKDVKKGLPIFYGDDSIPAMMGQKPKYRLLKEYEHKCKKCCAKMREASKEELYSLPCPDCGAKPDPDSIGFVNWD